MCILSHHVQLFVTLWTVAHQAPLSVEFSRQEYWSVLPFPSPGDLRDPGTEPESSMSAASAGNFSPLVPPGKPFFFNVKRCKIFQVGSVHWFYSERMWLIFFFPPQGEAPGLKSESTSSKTSPSTLSYLSQLIPFSSRSVFSSVTWRQNTYSRPCC